MSLYNLQHIGLLYLEHIHYTNLHTVFEIMLLMEKYILLS